MTCLKPTIATLKAAKMPTLLATLLIPVIVFGQIINLLRFSEGQKYLLTNNNIISCLVSQGTYIGNLGVWQILTQALKHPSALNFKDQFNTTNIAL